MPIANSKTYYELFNKLDIHVDSLHTSRFKIIIKNTVSIKRANFGKFSFVKHELHVINPCLSKL